MFAPIERHKAPVLGMWAMQPPTVLIADDDPVSLCVLHHCLNSAGFSVITAQDGRDVLALMEREAPDLVVLDVMMPVMDGMEALRRAKADQKLRQIPILMVTSREQDADIVSALNLGAADYLVKPFMPAELAARAVRIVAERRRAA
jgi:DNA-binding response OmpR family regulator